MQCPEDLPEVRGRRLDKIEVFTMKLRVSRRLVLPLTGLEQIADYGDLAGTTHALRGFRHCARPKT